MIAERLAAQLLSGAPARNVVEVVTRLLAVQAQDGRGARLAIRARTTALTADDVDRALTDRALVVSWLNRGTLHLVRSEDYPWLHALTTPQLATGNARRLAQEGVSPSDAERGVAVVTRALAEDGPLTRDRLRAHLDAAGVPTEGQALVHILLRATLLEQVVRGPMVGRHQAFVLARDWLGDRAVQPVDRSIALAELARRYLRGHGPADEHDLMRWAGITLGDARTGLRAISGEITQRNDGLVDLRGRGKAPPPALPPPRLLGAFEPVLLGWVSRQPLLGAAQQRLVTTNGIFRPFALAGGRAVATWGMPGGRVVIEPLDGVRMRRSDLAALEADAADVVRFLGGRIAAVAAPEANN